MEIQRRIKYEIRETLTTEVILLILANIGIFTVFSILTPAFATLSNVYVLLDFLSVLGMVSLAELILLIGGEIDVSIPSQMALVATIIALCNLNHIPTIISLVFTFITAIAIGSINGFFTAYIKLPSFLVTLATSALLQGAVILLTRYSALPIMDTTLINIFYGVRVAGTSIDFVWFLAIMIVVMFMLKYTRFGRRIYAVGGNAFAVWCLGIDIRKIKLELFIIASILTAIAGLILGARAQSARADMAVAYLLPAIAAPVLGGASLTGGYGSVIGTTLAALALQQITIGVYALGIEPAMYLVLQGAVLVVVLSLRIALQFRASEKISS